MRDKEKLNELYLSWVGKKVTTRKDDIYDIEAIIVGKAGKKLLMFIIDDDRYKHCWAYDPDYTYDKGTIPDIAAKKFSFVDYPDTLKEVKSPHEADAWMGKKVLFDEKIIGIIVGADIHCGLIMYISKEAPETTSWQGYGGCTPYEGVPPSVPLVEGYYRYVHHTFLKEIK